MDFTVESSYVTLLMQRLGRRSNTDQLRPSVVDELVQAQKRLELGQFLPWFLVKKETPAVSVPTGTVSIPVPADFIREEEITQPELVNVDGIKSQLKKGEHDILARKYLNASSGNTKYYSLLGNDFYFWPPPAELQTWNLWYYAKQPVITDSSEANSATNLWLVNAADWLLSAAGATVASMHLQKSDMAASFMRKAAQAQTDIMALHEARMHTNMNYSDGSEYQTA